MKASSRRKFLRHAAVGALAAPFITRHLLAAPPSQTVLHASIGASSQAGRDLELLARHPNVRLVAIADVDTQKSAPWKEKFPETRIYQDWRELLERERHLDSLNVSTPDHMHAPIAMSALQLGKHVYVQKPLAHDLYEVRQLARFAHGKKLVTQMGIQIQSTSEYRQAVAIVRSGLIGQVKEVHAWCGNTTGDTKPLPARADTPPASLNWDLWLGTAAARPFIGDGYYHPHNWRSRLDFGTGTFGDMGCHIFDPIFSSLALTAPLSVRSEGAVPNAWNWSPHARVHYEFPGTKFTAARTFKMSWYDGDQRPPPDVVSLVTGDRLPASGSISIGTKGVMLLPHIGRARLFPESQFGEQPLPKAADGNHYTQFIEAILGKGKTGANFDYAGPLTETVLLGGIASRFPHQTLEWNSRRLKCTNLAAANAFLRREYRLGWRVKGLS